MMAQTPILRLLTAEDGPRLAKLHERGLGPGRFARTAYRVREGAATESRLNLCFIEGSEIIGAVQFTPVAIGDEQGALLLGPLVIAETHKNQGWGLKLILEGMNRARPLGYRLVVLVGDLPYYARAGFARLTPGRIAMPGPVDPARLLYAELVPGALSAYRGLVRGSDRLAAPARQSGT